MPGGGPLEAEFIDLATKHIVSRGVGFFRSTAHVEKDIKEGLHWALMGLKEQTKFTV